MISLVHLSCENNNNNNNNNNSKNNKKNNTTNSRPCLQTQCRQNNSSPHLERPVLNEMTWDVTVTDTQQSRRPIVSTRHIVNRWSRRRWRRRPK